MGDIDSMSSTILEEIKHRELLDKKGLEGRKRVITRFTYEIDADYFIKIYNRI
jgi:glycosyltransferase involved in cell wall biosynthesis